MILLTAWQVVSQLPVRESPLKVTLDLAQLVMLGGLVWRLADMSGSVKNLTAATDKLRVTLDDIVLRVNTLEVREQERRDRRKGDP